MDLTKLSILVTGGAGFIGSNIVETLLQKGVKKIRILDNLVTGKMENIQNMLDNNSNLEFMYGDVSNLKVCRQATLDIDVVCHQAAFGSVVGSINNPLTSHTSNVNGFINILISAKERGIKRVVYASSSAVYGDSPNLPKVEDDVGKMLSPYAATKMIDEIYANVFTKCYGMECIGLRYFNIFGKRQSPKSIYAAVIPLFIDLIKKGVRPVINGDGSYSRDFVHVSNAVNANILALTTQNSDCFGEVFNIGSGRQTSLLELFNTLKRELNIDIDPIFGPLRPGDIPHSNANIDKAKMSLGYEPLITFDEGISELVKQIKFNKSPYKLSVVHKSQINQSSNNQIITKSIIKNESS